MFHCDRCHDKFYGAGIECRDVTLCAECAKAPRQELHIQQAIRADIGSRPGVVLYRNQVGEAFIPPRPGQKPRRVKYGLCEGSSDLIGWRSVTITQDMVGQTIAQFVAIEVKAPGAKTKKARLEKQKLFVACVQNSGGRAGFARSLEEAEEILGS